MGGADVVRVEVTVAVNDQAEPGAYRLGWDEVWAGLRRKAEDAVPFVAGMSECRVVERTDGGLVREMVVKGERIREDVRLEPPRRVSFERRDERAGWLIQNEIGEDADGALTLTFVMEVRSTGPDSEKEQAAERIRTSTLQVVRNTLRVIRETAARVPREEAGHPGSR
jgi:hypothetical protein